MARRTKLENEMHAANLKSEAVFKPPITKWINEQSAPVMTDFFNVKKTVTTDTVDATVDSFKVWAKIEKAGVTIVAPPVTKVAGMGNEIAFKLLTGVRDDPLKKTSARVIAEIGSKLVKEVTDETKKAINATIKAGLEKGKGWKAIGRELRPKVGLNSRNMTTLANFEEKLLRKQKKISGDVLTPKQLERIEKRVGVKSRKLHRDRNETIARTEAKRAMSEGQRLGYDSAGIKTLIWFALFDHDEECAAVNGHEFSIAAAQGAQPLHPR